MLEVTDAVVGAWSADRVAIRISPIGSFNGTEDPEGAEAGLYVAGELGRRDLAFLHLSEPDWAGGPELDDDYRRALRAAHPGPIVGAGNYDLAKAERLLEAGLIDAAAFGRSFIANPDLPRRLAEGLPLNPPRPESFYGGDAEGYTDYPAYAPPSLAAPEPLMRSCPTRPWRLGSTRHAGLPTPDRDVLHRHRRRTHAGPRHPVARGVPAVDAAAAVAG